MGKITYIQIQFFHFFTLILIYFIIMGFSQEAIVRSAQMHMQMKTGGIGRILLADGRPLFGDCGEMGSTLGLASSNRCAVIATHAVPSRVLAYRDLEQYPTAGPYQARPYVVTGPLPSANAGSRNRLPAPLIH